MYGWLGSEIRRAWGSAAGSVTVTFANGDVLTLDGGQARWRGFATFAR